MISKLEIEGLKSIDKLCLNFSNLNIFCGTNSAGKSTAIQSLLLLTQNSEEIKNPLNGHYVSLGEFREARNFLTDAKEIKIDATFNESCKFSCTFKEDENDVENSIKISNKLDENPLFCEKKEKVHYLSSSRIGQEDTYKKNIDKIDEFGLKGEYALHYFNTNKSNSIDKALIKNEDSHTLETQVNHWLSYIVGANIKTENIIRTDSLTASYSNENIERYVRPKNIGTGISYLISIIITCLASAPGDLVILENPEIHLHPKAQSKLMEFFVFISNANIQLIIETHSDHIFNGARVAINQGNKNTNIFYFTLNAEQCTEVSKIEFGKNGRILNHKEGLFDQFDTDLDKLLGL